MYSKLVTWGTTRLNILASLCRLYFSGELAQQRDVKFIFRGQVIEDVSTTLQQLGVTNNSAIHVHISQPRPQAAEQEPANQTDEREQHEREMKKLETNMTALETRLMTEREQHEKEMEKMRTRLTTESERHKREIETKLSTEREHHDSEMKKMETKLTAIIMTKLATEREQNEKEMAAVREKKEVCSKNGLLNQEHMHEAERSTSETILIIQAVL